MKKNKEVFRGIYVPLVTPFNQQDKLDEQMTYRLYESLTGYPIEGFYVGGSTGECFLQTVEERSNFLQILSKINDGKKSIIAHIGSTALKDALHLGETAINCKYDAVASVPPFYYRYSKKEIFQYYEELSQNLDLPLFVYNIPGSTGIDFTVEDLEYLLKIENIVGIKHTAKDFYIVERIKERVPESIIFNGPDEMLIAGLCMGCDGGIGSTYNLMPAEFCKIYQSFREGDLKTAQKYQIKVNRVIEILLSMNFFGAIKYLLNKRGINCGATRKPFSELNPSQLYQLDKIHETISHS